MALFESYERRIDTINSVLSSYGISSIEEAEKITKDAGLDVYEQVKKIQPICFENACWAYTVGAAIAIKKGCRKAADAAAAIGEGLQAFCIPGSVADTRKVGLGHGNLEKKKREKKSVTIFSNVELMTLWDNVDKYSFVDMILIGIYSGWRPQELAILKVRDVDLDGDTFFGGLKTDAGKNRIVPIHPLIKNLVNRRYEEAMELESEYLFNDSEGQRGTVMTYDKYRHRFEKIMKRLDMKHRPHETRHTFSTLAKAYDMKDNVRKLIMGHVIIDFTDRVYTHPMLEELRYEMGKVEKWYPYGTTPKFEAEDGIDI